MDPLLSENPFHKASIKNNFELLTTAQAVCTSAMANVPWPTDQSE